MKAVLWCLVLLPGLLAAQGARGAEAGPCATPEHRQFDFWIGHWDVTVGGAPAGKNHIERITGGCALAEHWTGASGVIGYSVNAWDANRGKWHQTWVDSSGAVLYLDGGWTGDAMVLAGTLPGEDGQPVRHRITWTPAPDGTVRQLWESSADGETWSAVFDGHYVKAQAP